MGGGRAGVTRKARGIMCAQWIKCSIEYYGVTTTYRLLRVINYLGHYLWCTLVLGTVAVSSPSECKSAVDKGPDRLRCHITD